MTAVEVPRAFVKAINRHDVEMLCRLMTVDHLFVDSGGGQYRGREAMRAGWLGYFAMFPDYTIEVQQVVADASVVIVVGSARGAYSSGGRSAEPVDPWSMPAAWRAVVTRGRVAVWQVFADNEPVRRILRRHGKETD